MSKTTAMDIKSQANSCEPNQTRCILSPPQKTWNSNLSCTMWKSLQLISVCHINCMIDWYVVADVSRLNTFTMFMHLKADPASYEGLFEKVNSTEWFPLNLLNLIRWNIMSLEHWTSLSKPFWRGVVPRRPPTFQESIHTALLDQTLITMR